MWKLKPSERLARWRDFREKLNSLPLDRALEQVQTFWAKAPFTPYYLDIEKPETWPDPWTLIYENYYCDVAKALGMLYTIAFTDHKPTIELCVYYDPKTRYNYNLVLINQGKYVLNMNEDEIVNIESIENNFKLKFKYSSADLKLDSY